jgi:flagellar basal-body rod protein FlgG
MLEGLYAAAAGMAAQQEQIDGVSNDLANASTTGYKHVRIGFRDLLYSSQGPAAGPTVLAGAGAAAAIVGRGQEQGTLQSTGEPLDVAIAGQGFLQVRRPDGSLALTRDGSLRLDASGRLTTADGDLLEPPVTVPQGTTASDLSIAADGTVRAGARTLGRIALVDVPAPDGLQPLGSNLFAVTAASGATRPVAAGTTQLKQGMLEGSNVDVGDEMVQLIGAQRSYEMASKAIQMQDQMLSVANQIKR